MFIHDEMHTSEGEEEMIVGAAKFGAVFGTFVGGVAMDWYGRRKSIAMSGIFFIIGPIIMAASQGVFGEHSYWPISVHTVYHIAALQTQTQPGLVLGRLIIGLGVGASAVVVPAYLGEMAPANKRGQIVALYELMLCVGLLASCIVDYALQGAPHNWRWMVGMPAFPASLMALALCILPESPRWLIMRGRVDEALRNIALLRKCVLPQGRQLDTFSPRVQRQGQGKRSAAGNGEGDQVAIEMELELIELWSTLEKDRAALESAMKEMTNSSNSGWQGRAHGNENAAATSTQVRSEGHANGSRGRGIDRQRAREEAVAGVAKLGMWQRLQLMLRWLLRGDEQRATVLVLWLAVVNQACASTAIINYAPKLIEDLNEEEMGGEAVHSTAIMATAAIGFAKLVGVAVGMFLLDSDSAAGGRRPLLIGGSFLMAVAMVGLAASVSARSADMVVVCMLLFILSFSASWAGGFWVIVSEVFSMTAKPLASSLCTATLFAAGAIADSVYLTLYSSLGSGAFLLYATVAAAGGVYVFVSLPETRGKSLLEVQRILQGKVAADGRIHSRSRAGQGQGHLLCGMSIGWLSWLRAPDQPDRFEELGNGDGSGNGDSPTMAMAMAMAEGAAGEGRHMDFGDESGDEEVKVAPLPLDFEGMEAALESSGSGSGSGSGAVASVGAGVSIQDAQTHVAGESEGSKVGSAAAGVHAEAGAAAAAAGWDEKVEEEEEVAVDLGLDELDVEVEMQGPGSAGRRGGEDGSLAHLTML